MPTTAAGRSCSRCHRRATDADARRAARPVVCYPVETLPAGFGPLRGGARRLITEDEVIVPPRDGAAFACRPDASSASAVTRAHRSATSIYGMRVTSRIYYSGKTRALHGTHVSVGDRLWSCFPYLRPMATITHDSLGLVRCRRLRRAGARCHRHALRSYTHRLLTGGTYHHCCHSRSGPRARGETGLLAGGGSPRRCAQRVHVHGLLADTGRYFMKASPARAGDCLEFFAEIDLLGGLSACPGGDCSAEHSSDAAVCSSLHVEILRPEPEALASWNSPAVSTYDRSHGTGTAPGRRG